MFHGDEIAAFIAWGTGWWIKNRLVWFTRFHGLGHGIVALENDPLGAVFAEFLFIFAFDDRKGFYVYLYKNYLSSVPICSAITFTAPASSSSNMIGENSGFIGERIIR